MKKLIAMSLFFFLFFTLITSVNASVTIQATIDQSIYVVFNFENINSTIYERIKEHEALFNSSTIPKIIMKNLKNQNLTYAAYHNPELVFDDAKRSIQARFHLSGSDILNFTLNKATMAKICYARTDWRKFSVNLTDTLSLDFKVYFGTPVAQWKRINYTDPQKRTYSAYYYNYTGPSPFDPLCYFILPTTATSVRAIGDTVIFEIPPSLEDVLLNSPFLIISALIIVNIAVFLYREVRK
ncbi:MAG: hypothetical protein AOA65_0089 [Candidatus Bathyarchaeota archaeon BA1]|nr:MAG: hypothetical protein AOA65_0089 [Candidatus Bathyarchaeota archaeon BA1]